MSTSSSAAGATALIAVIVQTGCGFLSGGRRGATPDDREDCFGRATVALTRAIQHTYIVSPVDMAGLIGMAQTLAVFHFGYHTLKGREVQFHGTDSYSFWAENFGRSLEGQGGSTRGSRVFNTIIQMEAGHLRKNPQTPQQQETPQAIT